MGINFMATLGLQVTFNVDAAAFINLSIATTFGVGLAAVMTSLLRTVGAEWSIRRLENANRVTLSEIANSDDPSNDGRLTGLMLDRLVLLAPRAKAAGHRLPDAIGQLRQGFNIVDLRRARADLTTYSRRRIDAVLIRLKRRYRDGQEVQASDLLLTAINSAIDAVRDEQGVSARKALLGLVGLRRSLFPEYRHRPTCSIHPNFWRPPNERRDQHLRCPRAIRSRLRGRCVFRDGRRCTLPALS